MKKKKNERYQKLSNDLKIAQDYVRTLMNTKELDEVMHTCGYDAISCELGCVNMTAEDKINFIQRFHNNHYAMAFLNAVNAKDILEEFICNNI